MRLVFRSLAVLLAASVSIVGILLWPEAESAVTATPGPHRVRVVETRQVIPSANLPDNLKLGAANNNLDAVRHTDGFVYLAFRTAPHHFASPATRIVVLRSLDERQWTFERSFALATDLREPRLLSVDAELFLYVSRLGSDPLAFEPQGMSMSVRSSTGTWSELEPFGFDGMIGWRTRHVVGVPAMLAYRGGEMTYEFGEPRQRIDLLRSDDGRDWRLWDPDHGAVYIGGGGEADFAQAGNGRFYGVIRAEAGDEHGWGSRVCTAPAEYPARWTCRSDPLKYDSPFAFAHAGVVYLVARRNLRGDGRFDRGIGPAEGPWRGLRSIWNQLNYSTSRKRCSLWRFEPDGPRLAFVLDLPSRGDTCFPAVLPGSRPGQWVIYDYSSPLDGTDPRWIQGQRAETRIYRHVLLFD
ncbi:MAG: hypothetical protein AAEJ52_00685 [Myxococcota bacterium]